jgi:hypothetical protein
MAVAHRTLAPALGFSLPASSKAWYSHHAAAATKQQAWNDGSYLVSQEQFQGSLDRLYKKALACMGLGQKAVRAYHKS